MRLLKLILKLNDTSSLHDRDVEYYVLNEILTRVLTLSHKYFDSFYQQNVE